MLFRYTVNFYIEDDVKDLFPEASATGQVTEKGIVQGESWGEAVNYIIDYCGKEYVEDISLYELLNPLNDNEIKDMLVQE